jgi:hypothetical protein
VSLQAINEVSHVFDAIQRSKAGAAAFCTNFFPVQAKIQSWIDEKFLFAEDRGQTVFFFRRDRDFWHWYYCAPDPASLQRALTESTSLKSEPLVLDLIGNEVGLEEILRVLEGAGFRRYSRLVRLGRAAAPVSQDSAPGEHAVTVASKADRDSVLDLINRSFDPYADQIPGAQEIELALQNAQILAVKPEGRLAALLYFETQGFTSTVRYWVVAESFRSHRFGAALIRHYFAMHAAVRRFVLWVTAANENAIQKYAHYGYAPDGLVDHVLVNQLIPS